MNNHSVSKANNLIDASYKLNVQAQKLILACLAKIDSRKAVPKEISLTAKEFEDLMGITNNARRDLYSAADSLFTSSIILRDENEEVELYWVQKKVKKLRGEGKVTLVWSDDILKYISQLKSRFTSYKIRHIAHLQSTHSIRIYELLMRFKDTNVRMISVDDFKAALGISDKYKEFKTLKRDVLNPSLKELNARSNLDITLETVKKGRSVVALTFEFNEKPEVQQELDFS